VREGDLTIDEVLDVVAAHFKVAPEQFFSRGTAYRPRLVARYLAFRFTRHSLPQIGNRCGGVTGTNVVYAIRCIERDMATDPAFAAEIAALKSRLK
jgi:chromosomal replication initiation ATPase DnaA